MGEQKNITQRKFRDLTLNEIAQICNGCGGKGGWVRPPYGSFFRDECNHHDYNYHLGGNASDRLKADQQLRAGMQRKIRKLRLFHRIKLSPWAHLYYLGVRTCGGRYFNWKD